MKQGFIQVYTGNGKGKTTAALGLALRAVCSGHRVIMLQFMKGMTYAELNAPAKLKNFTIEQYGGHCLIGRTPDDKDRHLAQQGLDRLADVIKSAQYDLVIADELNIALSMGLLSIDSVMAVIKQRHTGTELVITGRYAPRAIIDIADLVTVMTEVKHYYHDGVEARDGIER